MEELRFKTITSENWLQADPALRVFCKSTAQKTIETIISDDLLHRILEPRLSESVPKQVRALFEVARGSMCYGHFFYPLFTLGEEQLFRVAEAAITHKCTLLSAPKKLHFAQKVDYLIRKSIIPKTEEARWQGIRELRKIASHLDDQSIVDPCDAIASLNLMATVINQLFAQT